MYVLRNCNPIRVHVVNKTPWAEDMTTISAGYNELSFSATGRTFYFIFTRQEILRPFFVCLEGFPDTPCDGCRL
jgi:hypothetical protein